MAAQPSWFAWLQLTGLVTRHGPSAVLDALGHGWTYLHEPALRQDGAVWATLHDGRTAAGAVDVFILDLALFGRTRLRGCSACTQDFCPHVMALLTDLTVSQGIREALAEGRSVAPYMTALPGLRASAHQMYTAEQLAARWLPLTPVTALPSPLFSVVLPTGRHEGVDRTELSASDGTTAVEIRLRLPGQRAMLDPAEVSASAFPPEDRRILRLLTPLRNARKAWRATGADASVVLHLLAARAVPPTVEATGAPLVFSPVPVHLDVQATTVARVDLSLSVASLRDDVRTMYGVQGGRWEAGTDLAHPAVSALEARWQGEGLTPCPAGQASLFRGPYPYVWVPRTGTLHPVSPEVDLDAAWHLQTHPTVEFREGHGPTLFRLLNDALRGRGVALPPAETFGVVVDRPVFSLRVGGRPLAVEARLEARYARGARLLDPRTTSTVDGWRDAAAESAACTRIEEAGLRWDPLRTAYTARDDAAAWFWTRGVAALREPGTAPMIAVLVEASTVEPRARAPLRSRLAVKHAGGTLQVELAAATEGVEADMAAVRAALARKGRWMALDDGTLTRITDEFADLLGESQGTPGQRVERAVVTLLQLGAVDRLADLALASGALSVDAEVTRLRGRLRAMAVSEQPVLPTGLTATLRPYQRQAVAWLQFLHALGAGGVLADDMGLGKTVTALTQLLARVESDGPAPSLVVCPTSVVGAWRQESARYTPRLRVLSLHDLRSWTTEYIQAADVVITTYALLRRDVVRLAEIPFRYMVLDEAQGVKNADAETARAARRIKAEARIALTGTPVENRLGELWSLVDWCNPGLLGTRRHFETTYEKPLAARSDKALLDRLRATVRPFLLRRTRAQVLGDLPPKQEIDLACPLDPAHRRRYDALAAVVRKDLRGGGRSATKPSPIAVLTALLRLRQMACDPRLVDPLADPPQGKRAVLLDHVRSLVAEGRRALVFSQFVELLTLWRKDLDAEGIAYAWLDGSTTGREAVVKDFQEGNTPLFLISLKAGGTGLTLTAADTVFLCDPWWNPAVEDQAADRVHRMGQTRAVTVYRLVAEGTVESRVMDLKARKRVLTEAVLEGEAGALKGLSSADLDALLGTLDEVP